MSEQIEGCPQPDEPIRERAWTAEQEKVNDVQASKAYDVIDRYLRNNMDDDDYAEYSAELDKVYSYNASTLRQQATNSAASSNGLVDGEVSGKLVERAMNVYLDKLEHGQDDAMRAALEAVAPLLRAPGGQGGKVDEELVLEGLDYFDKAGDAGDKKYVKAIRAYINSLQAAIAQNAQGEAVARLKAVIERDRTAFCGLIVQLKGELQSRAWLGDENARAAGGYTYDEPGFIREFGDAWTAIMSALERAHRTFQDFADCPSGEAIRSAQADARAILDRHAERARVPDAKPLPDLMLASYHEAVGWNACREATLALSAAPSEPEGAA